ncbi:MAG: hypothetical protein AABY11_02005, partial [archaeon]
KWIKAHVQGIHPGVYHMEVNLRVLNTAPPQETLKLFYKAQTENGDTLRDPVDANPVDELYAATKSATYQVGVTTTCDTHFCFDASIFDVENELIEDVTDQYNARVFGEYRMTFNILNNGDEFHTNSNLRISASGDGIDFTTYELFTADAQLLKGTVNDSEFASPINLGNFTPQKKVGGTIHFRPTEVGTSVMVLELVSDFEVVFSKTIQVNITGDKSLIVTLDEDVFPSGVPFTVNLHVEDADTGDEVDEALVTLENNLGIILASTFTDDAGNADIELPAQFAGKKIEVRVQKEEYNPFSKIVEVSSGVVSITPSTLGIGMNVKTNLEKNTPFTLTNLLTIPVSVKSITLQGNLKGLIDREAVESSLLAYTDIVIPAKGELEVNLRSVLTPEALALVEHEDLSVVLAIEIASYGSTHVLELPIKYTLGVSSEVDDPTCLNV